MQLIEHVHCVGVTFKMTEQVEQWNCIKFCIKLEHSRNYSGDSKGCSYGQPVIGSFTLTMRLLMHHILCRIFLQNMKSPRWLSPPVAQIWHPATSGFSQNWNHFWKGRDFTMSNVTQENTTGQLMAIGGTVWGPKVPTLKGTEASLPYIQYFLYLVSSSINASIFNSTRLDTFRTSLPPSLRVCVL